MSVQIIDQAGSAVGHALAALVSALIEVTGDGVVYAVGKALAGLLV